MVKKIGVEQTGTQQAKSMEQVMAENEALLRKVSELESIDPIALQFMAEERAIKRGARVDSDKILVKEITDHKNISLWTKWGKRIGPLHRDNALSALRQFAAIGVSLSTKQPTTKEISDWMDSPDGQAWVSKEEKKKDDMLATKKKGAMEKILKQMAEQYGLTMSAMTGILKANEIKPLSAGPGRQ
jgi:hypothetical protein